MQEIKYGRSINFIAAARNAEKQSFEMHCGTCLLYFADSSVHTIDMGRVQHGCFSAIYCDKIS